MEINEYQSILLNIFLQFKAICDTHHLRYYAMEGTLLGAVRHQGFIPWDDDIDLSMPRKDFEKFIEIAPTLLNGPYKLTYFATDISCKDYVARVVDCRHTVRLSLTSKPREVNSWIDIVPMDGMPKGKVAQKLHFLRLQFKKLLVMWSDMDYYVILRDNRSRTEKLLIRAGKLLRPEKWLNTHKRIQKLEKVLKKYDFDTAHTVINYMSEYKQKSIYSKDLFSPSDLGFEDTTIKVPKGYEVILRQIYNDYMKLPPENQRNKHCLDIID